MKQINDFSSASNQKANHHECNCSATPVEGDQKNIFTFATSMRNILEDMYPMHDVYTHFFYLLKCVSLTPQ